MKNAIISAFPDIYSATELDGVTYTRYHNFRIEADVNGKTIELDSTALMSGRIGATGLPQLNTSTERQQFWRSVESFKALLGI
jgi:hypothetical protein